MEAWNMVVGKNIVSSMSLRKKNTENCSIQKGEKNNCYFVTAIFKNDWKLFKAC